MPLFPLPLTPFEYYYYLDDRPAYPTTFPVELVFTGNLDRERFTAALAATIARHPLLSALLDDAGRRPQWIGAGDRPPQIDWAEPPAPLAPEGGEYLDLRKHSGLRTFVRADWSTARVVFQFHHACCDGLASLQFVQDLLAAYQNASDDTPQPVPLRPLDPELLPHRGRIAVDNPPPATIWNVPRDAWYTAKVWASILLAKPVVLAAGSAGHVAHAALGFENAVLAREETDALRSVAKQLGVTVNDLLLRDFLTVVRQWNASHGGAPRGRWRINVPVNVRTRADAQMPVANRIGYAFVSDTTGDDDPRRLLDVVRSETSRIKEWKLGLYFLGGLAFAEKVPGVLPWFLRRRRAFATAVLSNVGRFVPAGNLDKQGRWTCGGLVLESVTGAPPLRDLTRAACIVIEYAGRTLLTMRCDPHSFSAGDTRELADAFARQVRETIRAAAVGQAPRA